MKLDYKSPLKELGLLQRRRLFHIILGSMAFLCFILALTLRDSATHAPVGEIAAIQNIESPQSDSTNSKTTNKKTLIASSIELPKDSKKESTATQNNEKPGKQTLMTLAEVKKADRTAGQIAPEKEKTTETVSNTENDSKKDASNKASKNDKAEKIKEQAKQEQEYETITIRKGDSLAKIFKRQGYSQKDLETLLASNPKTGKKFQSLQIKQTLKIYYDQKQHVQALALVLDKGNVLQLGKIQTTHIAKQDKPLKAEKDLAEATIAAKASNVDKAEKLEKNAANAKANAKDSNTKAELAKAEEAEKEATAQANAEKQIAFGKGTMKDSLYLAGKRAGLDKAVVSQLVEIFSWNIDFALMQPTDTFRVLFEEKRVDGEKVGAGPILAAEITHKGKTHRAVRYTDKSGQTAYFTPDGFGMKESFARYPLAFSHISSGFGSRKHPVRHKIRKHTGVDFAAPRGTRVNTTGDGKVIFVGTRGGYGRVVEIQHGDRYSTLYAHLSKFAPKLKAGDCVKKGQQIGCVGRTGLATGDHLHYEFRIDGIHRDPLSIALPKKNPIPDVHKRHFLAHAKELLRLMDQHENKVNMVRNEYPRNE